MTYSVQDDLLQQISEEELIQLTDDDRTGLVDSSRVGRAIEDADAEINGYLAKKHTVPIATVPDLVRNMSVTIAIYNLYSRRDEIPESRMKRYRDMIKLLENISKGVVTLGEVPAPAENPGESGSFSAADRKFSREKLESF